MNLKRSFLVEFAQSSAQDLLHQLTGDNVHKLDFCSTSILTREAVVKLRLWAQQNISHRRANRIRRKSCSLPLGLNLVISHWRMQLRNRGTATSDVPRSQPKRDPREHYVPDRAVDRSASASPWVYPSLPHPKHHPATLRFP